MPSILYFKLCKIDAGFNYLLGRMTMKLTHRVKGHSLIRLLIRSRRPAICLLRNACFVCAFRHAHSLTHSLAPRLMGMRFMYINWMHWSFIVSIQSALTRSLTLLTRPLARLHHSLACSLTRSRDHGKMYYIMSQFQHVTPTPRRHMIIQNSL